MPQSATGLQTIRTRAVTRRVRVAPGRAWWACLGLLPLLLAAAAAFLGAGGVQDDLRHRVDYQLLGSGWNSITFDVSGRDVTAHAPGSIDRTAVKKAIRQVEGVRSVEVTR